MLRAAPQTSQKSRRVATRWPRLAQVGQPCHLLGSGRRAAQAHQCRKIREPLQNHYSTADRRLDDIPGGLYPTAWRCSSGVAEREYHVAAEGRRVGVVRFRTGGISGAEVQPTRFRLGWIANALLGAAVSVTVIHLREKPAKLPRRALP